MKIGAQMYTMRNFIQNERDMEYTFQKISEIGYSVVQISGIGAIEPKKLRGICDKNGLEIALTHTNPDRILNETEKVIEEHNILGAKYIGMGCMPSKYLDNCFAKKFVEDYKEAALKIKKADKLLMYHNHNFEWEKFGGERIIETLINGFEPDEMGFTLDTFWVQHAGADILRWIEILKDRIPCVHLKDMDVKNSKQVMAPVGEGNIDFKTILEKLDSYKKTEFALVEQDDCYELSPFQAIEKSYINLKKLGYK